jgi:ketosteroid isomerase-like protein
MPIRIFALIGASALFALDQQQAVLEAQRQWIEGYNHRDEKALAAIEAEDFRVVFGDGSVQTRSDQITNIRKALPRGANYEIAVETTDVRLYGKAAVLTGIVIEKTQSASQRSRYTDTWILQKGRWRVVSSQLCDLK